MNLSLSPAYMTQMTHVVLARDLYRRKLAGDEPEELEVVPWKMSELHMLLGATTSPKAARSPRCSSRANISPGASGRT